ncbi:MAG: YraN family protein [Acidobacteria bacterium]|nr:YraN family protein [Acidobacteriota bacterium]
MNLLRPLCLLSDAIRRRARRKRMDPGQALGLEAEDLAHRLLQSKGFTVVARNWTAKSHAAEIDLIALGPAGLAFVEVKARATGEFSEPERQITPEKQRKLAAAAAEFRHGSQYRSTPFRFDLVTVILEPQLRLAHYEDAWRVREALAAHP